MKLFLIVTNDDLTTPTDEVFLDPLKATARLAALSPGGPNFPRTYRLQELVLQDPESLPAQLPLPPERRASMRDCDVCGGRGFVLTSVRAVDCSACHGLGKVRDPQAQPPQP